MLKAACLALLLIAGGVLARDAVAAAAIDPHSLKIEEKPDLARVEFRFRLTEPEPVEGVTATSGGQAVPVQFTPFAESATPSTAVLFLIDKTDPKRAKTVEAGKALVARLLERAGPDTQFAVYALASDLEPIAEFGATKDEARAGLEPLKASGMATELYRVSIEAINVLAGTDAARKALVLLSDGRAEDTTFTIERVVEQARQAGVPIFAVGYAESASLTPHVQSLRRLAAETGGLFAEAELGTRREPEWFARDLFATLQSGGTAMADVSGLAPGAALEFEVRTKEQRLLKHSHLLTATAAAAAAAPVPENHFWLFAALGGALLVAGAAIALLRRREPAPLPPAAPRHVYARLKLLDSDGTEHLMEATALRIGRGADNDLALRNDSISRHHAEIHRARDGTFSITDLGAGNGVLVNGRKVERATLEHEDVIELGEVRLRFLVA